VAGAAATSSASFCIECAGRPPDNSYLGYPVGIGPCDGYGAVRPFVDAGIFRDFDGIGFCAYDEACGTTTLLSTSAYVN
jgi:hypothetical protein